MGLWGPLSLLRPCSTGNKLTNCNEELTDEKIEKLYLRHVIGVDLDVQVQIFGQQSDWDDGEDCGEKVPD